MPSSERPRPAISLPATIEAPHIARAFVDEIVTQSGLVPDDRAGVEVVVSELVTNAVRHGCPPIVLEVSADEHALRIAVSDGSSGVPAIPARPDVGHEGGRGLSITSQFAADWGVEWLHVGKCVWAAFGLAGHPLDGPPALAAVKVLVVNDSADVRFLVRTVLELEGFEVIEAAGAEEAFALLDDPVASTPAVVVVDNRMPNVSGVEVARGVRHRIPALPIVMFSAFLNDEITAAARDAGVAVCVPGDELTRLPDVIRRLANQPAE